MRHIFSLVIALFVFAVVGNASTRPHIFGCGNANGGWTLLDPAGYSEEMYRAMRQAGVRACRIGASWANIESTRGVYNWTSVDKQVELCLANGIEPYCLIVNAPSWADGNPDAIYDTPILESAAPYFTAFCTAMAQRYKGKIKYYEFWNEENGYGWHHENNQFNWYWEYLPWLKRAYSGLKAGDPDCKVAVGGLDDADGHAAGYLSLLYSIGAKGWFDAVATHPYDKGRGAENLRNRLRALHNVMVANGDGDKPLWITEWGYNYDMDEQQIQADKIAWYLGILLEPEFSYVTMASYLAFTDIENNIGDWGFTDQCLRPKMAFNRFQSYPRPGEVTVYSVRITNIGPGKVKVTWKTTPAADSQVFYGLTADYGQSTPLDPTLRTDHSVILKGLQPGKEHHLKVRSGEYDSGDYRFFTAGTSIYNPGFEGTWRGGAPDGWQVDGYSRRLDSSTVGWINQVRSGSHALLICLATSWGYSLNDTAWQQVLVEKGRGYEFGAWLWNHPDNASPIARVGTDPTGGTDPNSANVIWSDPFTAKNSWQRRTVKALAQSSVVTVFIQTRTLVIDNKMHYFCTDDATLTTYPTTNDALAMPDGAQCTIVGVVSASSDQFSNHCYLQQGEVPSGIRVDGSGDFCNLWDVLLVTGTIGTSDGERRLTATSVSSLGSSPALRPVGMNGVSFAHPYMHPGALVKVWGTVKRVDPAEKRFTLSDGGEEVLISFSDLAAGNTITPPAVGEIVAVTGICCVQEAPGQRIHILKPASQADIVVVDP